MTFDTNDRHPLTPLRLVGMVVLSLIASVLAIVIAIAILAYLIFSAGAASSLETSVHGCDVVRVPASRSRPDFPRLPGGTAHWG